MKDTPWEGFRIELGRAIDQWSGGGQRAFAKGLEEWADQNGISVPTSYRTLLNYLSGKTTPSRAWVDAAAHVLRWNPERLWTGIGEERTALEQVGGLTGPSIATVHDRYQARTSAIVQYFNRHHTDLPPPARSMLFYFLDVYFGEEVDGWCDSGAGTLVLTTDDVTRIRRALDDYFGPLLSRPKMSSFETIAMTAALTSAGYTRLAAKSMLQRKENPNA